MEDLSRENVEKPEDLGQEALARFALDMFHRLIVHYTLWFTEVEHQFGVPKALEIMKVAKKNSYNIQMYARINVQSIIDEGPNTIVFQMNDCRVQSA